MKNLDKLKKQQEAIKTEIRRLTSFRDTPFTRKFRRQLEGESSVIKQKIQKLTGTKESRDTVRSERETISNKNRSEKMKRTWRYLKAIRDNYPIDIPLRQLRTALRKHRQGLETDVSDVAWRNPSP